jgi:hypothetical protein
LLLPNAGHDERLLPPAEQPSFDFLRRELGGAEPGVPGGFGVGGGGGGLLAPMIAIVAGGVVVGAMILAVRKRRRRVPR